MAEFGGMEENWGLQAVVSGSTSDPFYGDLGWQNYENNCFDLDFTEDVFQSSRMLKDELQELYKPFCLISDSASSAPDTMSSISVKIETKEAEEMVQKKELCVEVNTSNAQSSKDKRRKNQQRRVVVQSEGLSCDEWAWRKYGQKPIKGSPYPRSYYRCSSSKGCLARKQAEQSCTDPSVFIITYRAEHNHTQPTRKNALAGTTRQKFPSPKISSITDNKATESKETSSTSSSTDVRIASVEDGCSIRQEINEEIFSSDMKMEDEFFAGLEDLDGLISELSGGKHPCWSKMFSMSFCS